MHTQGDVQEDRDLRPSASRRLTSRCEARYPTELNIESESRQKAFILPYGHPGINRIRLHWAKGLTCVANIIESTTQIRLHLGIGAKVLNHRTEGKWDENGLIMESGLVLLSLSG